MGGADCLNVFGLQGFAKAAMPCTVNIVKNVIQFTLYAVLIQKLKFSLITVLHIHVKGKVKK